MPNQPLTVLIDSAYLDRVPDVVVRLEAAGLQVRQVLDAVGAVVGSASAERIDALRALDGVAGVELEQAFQLPPPEEELQ